MNTVLSKSWLHLAAVAVFLLLCALYFRPQLSGKIIEQGDIMQYLGMAQEIHEYKKKTGEETLWTNSMFGGMPTYQINTVTAGNNLKWVEKVGRLFIAEPIGQFFLAMLSFYVLMVVLGVNLWVAIIGAVAFGLTTNNLILYEAGHLTKLQSISFFPLIAAGMLLAFKGRYLAGGVIFALGLGLNIYSNHVQMTYYLALTIVFLGIAQLIYDLREDKALHFAKAAGVLLLGAALALGATASNLMTTFEYSRDTMRGKPILSAQAEEEGEQISSSSQTEGLAWDYAMQWSNGGMDVLAGFIPGAAGGGSAEKVGKSSKFYQEIAVFYRNSGQVPPPFIKAPLYHGKLPFTSGPIYFGAVVFFLFLLGLLTVKGPVKWWIGLGVLLTILLSMGKNLEGFNRFFFDYVPLYNKFRTPNSVLSITSFLMPLLGFLAFAQVLKNADSDNKWNQKALYIAAGVSAGIALIFAIVGPSLYDLARDADQQYIRAGFTQEGFIADRKSLMRSDAFRSLILVLLSAGLIWAYQNRRIKSMILVGGIGLLVLFDVWSVGRRYLDEKDFSNRSEVMSRFQPTPADELILKDSDPHFRVFDRSGQGNPFASSRASYFHKSIGGYHAAKLQRYQDLIDRHLMRGNFSVFNMLNTKYFIMTDPDDKPAVEPNVNALGNAWFVSNIKTVPNADAEIDALGDFNPEEEAVIHQEFQEYIKGFTPQKEGVIRLTEYRPNRLTYQSTAPTEQLAVFSEIWYGPGKGWQAYIDGQPVEHIRANYVLRAMRIPAGTHQVEFVFAPESFQTGKLISLVSSSIVLLGFLGLIGFYGYRSYQKWQREPAPRPHRPAPAKPAAHKPAAPARGGQGKKKKK